MKIRYIFLMVLLFAGVSLNGWAGEKQLKVVTTLSDYAVIAKAIGGDRIDVQAIVKGEQDAHFIRPKPSFVDMVRAADVLIDTGLDLEMWLPTVIDKAGNNRVRSGQNGYVAASRGMHMLEKPQVMSRSEGGLHVYGNPHVTCSPINMRVAARNIATGLIKNDPEGKKQYKEGLKAFLLEMDERMFGKKLVQILGGDILCSLAVEGKLIPFLEKKKLKSKSLIDYLGGWMKQSLPLRGTPIVTYHKNWVYFVKLFGVESVGTVEPKPGIPPSPKHVLELTSMMKKRGIKIILAANYFDEHKIRAIAAKVGAEPVIVPLYVGGGEGVDDYFELVDCWVNSLVIAAKNKGITK
ncbi:MAG: zinc ABC transporter substrate-binding protein [Kiritimatiellae bacterium]|nr:zinc ABC transporter substrate-binding protein [Kiritimatiellia bacterium]